MFIFYKYFTRKTYLIYSDKVFIPKIQSINSDTIGICNPGGILVNVKVTQMLTYHHVILKRTV